MKTETTSKELRLEFFRELYERAKSAFSETAEEFERHLEQYRGSKAIDGSSEEALTVRNVTYEIIESQVSSEIPMPKVDPAAYSTVRDKNAHTIEMLCTSVRDKLPFEEMNDIDERNTYIFGGGVWLVEWDNSQAVGSEVGGVKVHVISPRDFIPEPCVCRVEDMEYCFIRTRATRGDVMRKYRVADEDASLLECEFSAWESDCADDTVSVIICFYRGEGGEVGRFIFSGDITLSDLPDYYRRRIAKCRKCGKPVADCRCEDKELYDEGIDTERVRLTADQLGRIFGGARVHGGEISVPYYLPRSFPIVIRKNTSALAFLGSLIVALAYKRGLMPAVKSGIGAIGGAVSQLKDSTESYSKYQDELLTEFSERLCRAEEVLERFGQAIDEIAEKTEDGKSAAEDRANMKTLMSAQIDMLYDIFMTSSLPQYQKDAVNKRIGEMKEVTKSESHVE